MSRHYYVLVTVRTNIQYHFRNTGIFLIHGLLGYSDVEYFYDIYMLQIPNSDQFHLTISQKNVTSLSH